MDTVPSKPKKAVLIVCGAWHVPEHYSRLVEQLESQGIRTICPQLPTCNNAFPPDRTLYDDVSLIKKIVTSELAQGTHLTVVAHSYGGVIATAALGEFAENNCSSVQNSDDVTIKRDGKVTDVVYLTAFMPLETQSIPLMFDDHPPPPLKLDPSTNLLHWTDPVGLLYNDLSVADAQWAESLCVNHSADVQATTIQKACTIGAWRVIPTSYIICENDLVLPPLMQEKMIQDRNKDILAGQGTKKPIQVFRCGGSHSPFLSMPEKCSKLIHDIMVQNMSTTGNNT